MLFVILESSNKDTAEKRYLDKILMNAGFTPSEVFISYFFPNKKLLWAELKTHNPKLILTAGQEATKTMLKISKKNIKMQCFVHKLFNVEYMESNIMPIYDLHYLFNRGVALGQELTGRLKHARTKFISNS